MDVHEIPTEPPFVSAQSDGSSRSTSTAPSTPGPVPRHRGLSPTMPPWRSRLPAYEQRVPTSPYLCEACSSILTMDGLEIDRPYSHHTTLQSFLAAHQMGCNMCRLSLFEGPRIEDWLNLAEGRITKTIPADEDQDAVEDTSSSIEDTRHRIEEHWGFADGDELLVSFTGLWVSSNGADSVVARVRLNPAYEEFIPVGMKPYERTLWERWDSLAFKARWECRKEIITAQSTSRPG